jgi:high-affinity K+ transport system ATPase subunit B
MSEAVNFVVDVKDIIKDMLREKLNMIRLLSNSTIKNISDDELKTKANNIYNKYIKNYNVSKEEDKYDFILYIIQNFDLILDKD